MLIGRKCYLKDILNTCVDAVRCVRVVRSMPMIVLVEKQHWQSSGIVLLQLIVYCGYHWYDLLMTQDQLRLAHGLYPIKWVPFGHGRVSRAIGFGWIWSIGRCLPNVPRKDELNDDLLWSGFNNLWNSMNQGSKSSSSSRDVVWFLGDWIFRLNFNVPLLEWWIWFVRKTWLKIYNFWNLMYLDYFLKDQVNGGHVIRKKIHYLIEFKER